MILCEGIPDTLSALVSGLKDTGACGLYGTGGWQTAWLPLFRRADRVYVALDRDATDRAIALARTFGTRGCEQIFGALRRELTPIPGGRYDATEKRRVWHWQVDQSAYP